MSINQTTSMPSNQRNNDQTKDSVAVELPTEVLGELKWLSERMGMKPLDALRHAISTEAYVQSEIQRHGYALLKRKDKKV